jgi:hypothetical protein
MSKMLMVGCLLLGSCVQGDEQVAKRIQVSQVNDLGIVALEIERSTVPNGEVFELRGLDANAREVASLRLLTGTISDLPDYLPGPSTVGSELVVTVKDTPVRMVTRQMHGFQIGPFTTALQAFLDLNEVAVNLKQQAHIVVNSPAAAETAYGGPTQYTAACIPTYLYTTPVSDLCCTTGYTGIGDAQVTFVRPSDGAVIVRTRNYNHAGAGCVGESGQGACTTDDCYYGPLGFTAPVVYTGTGTAYVYVRTIGASSECAYAFGTKPSGTEYGNVTGDQARGQSCPSGDPGGAASVWQY